MKWEWRGTHPRIKQFWYDIDGAALLAVRERGKIIKCGRILLKCAGMFLQIKLPSGRKLSYPYPRIETRDWLDRQREVVLFKDASAGQWRDIRHGDGAYGGVWTENIVSGLCRGAANPSANVMPKNLAPPTLRGA